MRIDITARECPVTGELGYLLDGQHLTDHMVLDTGDGTLIAHDIVEHVNGLREIGGLEDELEALGAIWLVRGQFADLNRPYTSMHTPERSLASDIVNIAQYTHRPLRYKRTNAFDYDEDFDSILEYAREQLREEEPFGMNVENYLIAVKHLMRTGARKLQRRFSRFMHPDSVANSAFWNIRNAIKRAGSPDYEYQRFKLVSPGWLHQWTMEEVYGQS